MNPSKYQDFFSQLPSGTSEITTSKGETVVIVKADEIVTLTKENASHAVTQPMTPCRRLNFSFVAEATVNGSYTLNDCWEESPSAEELALHYPVTFTNLFIAESIIEDVLQQPVLASV
jgi:hypothetical protein